MSSIVRTLGEQMVASDPFTQFDEWFREARGAGIAQPEGMALGTVDASGIPSVRIVLLKSVDERGFVFFTNYGSRKARAIEATGRAALTFWWEPLERQVRIEGIAERTSATESDAYFASRPRGSRIGAIASPQSSVIASRDTLEARVQELENRYPEGSEIPRPEHWGGFRVLPERVEFWQGRASRLHDRIVYQRSGEGWALVRLAP